MKMPPIAPRALATRAAASTGLQPVPNTSISPGKEVCRVVVKANGREELATGWLLSLHAVVTAAHVFHNKPDPVIQVSPGFNGGAAPFGTHETKRFEFAPDGSDCAVVFLRENVHQDVGAFGFGTADTSGPMARVRGYTGDTSGRTQMHGEGAFMTIGARLEYEIPTKDGQSGGPVWGSDDLRTVIGIHRDFQLGVGITEALFGQLSAWRNRALRATDPVRTADASALVGTGPARAGDISLASDLFAAASNASADTAPNVTGARGYEALGTRIGEAARAHLAASAGVTVVIDGESAPGVFSFKSECVLAGLAPTLPRPLSVPQLLRLASHADANADAGAGKSGGKADGLLLRKPFDSLALSARDGAAGYVLLVRLSAQPPLTSPVATVSLWRSDGGLEWSSVVSSTPIDVLNAGATASSRSASPRAARSGSAAMRTTGTTAVKSAAATHAPAAKTRGTRKRR